MFTDSFYKELFILKLSRKFAWFFKVVKHDGSSFIQNNYLDRISKSDLQMLLNVMRWVTLEIFVIRGCMFLYNPTVHPANEMN